MPAKAPNALLHGALDALILKTLTRGPRHGYAIARYIEDSTGDAVFVEEGSSYPALYRMEGRGWIEAEWGVSELGRRAKLYRLTAAGRAQLAAGDRQLASLLDRCFQNAAGAMRRSLRSWLWRVPLTREVDDGSPFISEMRTRELVDQGIDADTARQVALARLGDLAALRRTCLDEGRKRDTRRCESGSGSKSSATM